jgi:hypothetical protein
MLDAPVSAVVDLSDLTSPRALGEVAHTFLKHGLLITLLVPVDDSKRPPHKIIM